MIIFIFNQVNKFQTVPSQAHEISLRLVKSSLNVSIFKFHPVGIQQSMHFKVVPAFQPIHSLAYNFNHFLPQRNSLQSFMPIFFVGMAFRFTGNANEYTTYSTVG